MHMFSELSLDGSVSPKVSNNLDDIILGILMTLTFITICGITDGAFPHY